jgi:uncharacterized protein YggE
VPTTPASTRGRLTWLASGLGLAVLALSVPGVAAPVAAQDDETDLRTISVTGTGLVKAEPDLATISVGVTKQAREASGAARQAASAMDAVITALLGLGIAETDIQTTTISLEPRYDWDKDPAPIVAWAAANSVSVNVRDIDTVGDVVDAAIAAGANTVGDVAFSVEDTAEAEAIARSAAVADARAIADQLASDAGVSIIGVVRIVEGSSAAPRPIDMAGGDFYAEAARAQATPVMPGQVELSVNVSIDYEIG